MNSRRTVIIAAALALAAIAFFGVIYYLNGVKEKAYGEATLVDVWVVKKAVPKGMAGATARNQGYVDRGKIPSEYRPGSALNEVSIRDIDSKVAINALSPGQVVVDGHFVDPNVAQVTFSQRVPPGQVAVTVSVDQVRGVAGLLVPGDKVNVLTIGNVPGGGSAIRTLYQNVDILAIGNKPAPTAGDTAARQSGAATGDSGLITFAVPLEAAERLVLAANGADGTSIYLALVPPENGPVVGPPVITSGPNGNLFNTSDPTPYPTAP